jgi:hypothetical protein
VVKAYEDEVSATMEVIREGFGNGLADSGGRACDEDGGDVRRGIGFVANSLALFATENDWLCMGLLGDLEIRL